MDGFQRVARLQTALAERVGQQRYDTWFGRQTRFHFHGTSLLVQVASTFLRDFIRQNFCDDLELCCADELGPSATIDFEIDASLLLTTNRAESISRRRPAVNGDGTPSAAASAGARDEAEARSSQPTILKIGSQSPETSCSGDARLQVESPSDDLRRAMTFESLILGRANQMAVRTGEWIANGLHPTSSALFWGPTGVGKTHLLRAIRTEFRRHHPQARAIYLTAEQFTGGFVEAIQGKGLPSFRHKCRDADLLLLDDAHFFSGKRATLEELLYTIDALASSGRRLILASDRSLGELQILGAELVSRMASGAVCEIGPPDFAMRIEIVRRLSLKMGMALDDPSLELVATQVTSGARELQGALVRLELCAATLGAPVDHGFVESTLGEIAIQNTTPVKLMDIQDAICDVFGIDPSGLRSDGKSRALSEPRMLAMWLARKYTRAPWSEIGQFFGRRSHSTVISAHRRMQRLMSEQGTIGVADKTCAVEDAIRRVERALRRA